MITISFERGGNSIYVAHTDILRSLNRTFRRAGIKVSYSGGYNRHMKLKLTQPLPFGIASKEEWVSADVENDMPCEEILQRFNENCPPYIRGYSCYKLNSNPNLAGRVVASDYFISNKNALGIKDKILNSFKDFEINTRDKNKEIITKKVSDLIYKAEIDENGIYLLIAFGNSNLRIDSTAEKLNELFDLDIEFTDIVRLCQYVKNQESLIKASDYVRGLL